jgi:hypothetical protein
MSFVTFFDLPSDGAPSTKITLCEGNMGHLFTFFIYLQIVH